MLGQVLSGKMVIPSRMCPMDMNITRRTDGGWLVGGEGEIEGVKRGLKGVKGLVKGLTLRLATGKKSMSSLPAQQYPHSRLAHSLTQPSAIPGGPNKRKREHALNVYGCS